MFWLTMDKETYDNLPFDVRFMADMIMGTLYYEAAKEIFSRFPYKPRLDFVKPTELKLEAANAALEKLTRPIYGTTNEIFERILKRNEKT